MPAAADSIIDDLYEAAVLPEFWPIVLEKLSRRAHAVGASLFTLNGLQQNNWTATENFAPIVRRFVEEGYTARNVRPVRGLATRYAGFMSDLDVMTMEEMDRDPIYTELLRPSGYGWSCGSVVPVPNGDLLVFDFNRGMDMGPFDRREFDILDGFRPHLARAGLVAARLQLARVEAASAVMAALGLPGAVLGSRGHVLATTPLLEGLSPHIRIQAFDRLRIGHKPVAEMFEQALARIDLDDGGVRSIPVPAIGEAPALVVHLVPIRRRAHDIFAKASALLIATPVTSPIPPNVGLLSGLFDLTPAEDRVARALAEGHSVESGAAALSVSPETVRSQLKSVMAKTGTTRQAELVGLLAGATSFSLPRG
jgi:DNA-binding CsgD family transcriptional regulator